MDEIAECLGIIPLNEEIDIEKLFQDHNIILFDSDLLRQDALERNSEIVVCDVCSVSGNRPNMMRWHFENCTTIFRKCEQCENKIPRQGIKNYLYNQKKFCNRTCYMNSKKGKPPIVMTEEVKLKISIHAKTQSEERSERMKKNKVWLYSGRGHK
jgi:hypothetical protein